MQQNQEQRLKILFLPRWYPNRFDPMPGLFIQRQAEAVSDYCDVAVLYVHADEHNANTYEIDVADEKGLHVVRIYYKVPSKSIRFVAGFAKLYRFFKANVTGFRVLKDFSPDLLHVHVLTRQGCIAFLHKILTRKPYVITEHWSRYFDENPAFRGILRKDITKHVIKFSSAVLAVSERLKEAMQKRGLKHRDFRVLPNPVDVNRFRIVKEFRNRRTDVKRIIHISCFEDKPKNISGFLRVVKRISLKRKDLTCSLVGKGPEWEEMKHYAEEIGIPADIVSFPGLKEGDELVEEINRSDFFVLSSHYETFGSVVIECLCCGVPGVATDVGIVPSVINGANGLIVPPGDENALQAAIEKMLDQCRDYDPVRIREEVGKRFDNEVIGRELFQLYQQVSGKQKQVRV